MVKSLSNDCPTLLKNFTNLNYSQSSQRMQKNSVKSIRQQLSGLAWLAQLGWARLARAEHGPPLVLYKSTLFGFGHLLQRTDDFGLIGFS